MQNRNGILILNLGSPDSPSVPDVRRYLAQFLMDPYVLDVPKILRWLIVYLTILPRRPKASAHAYHEIWTDEGSPLVVTSREFVSQLRSYFPGIPIALGMRYGNPSIESAVAQLQAEGVTEIVAMPMYPHYAMSSVTTATVELKRVIPASMTYRVVPPFFSHPGYIQAMAESIRPILPAIDHLLFSYHGLPEHHLTKTDPTDSHCMTRPDCCQRPSPAHATCYRHQVMDTTRLTTQALGMDSGSFSVSFQSRLGRDPWLKPFTDQVLIDLAKSGVKRLGVVCPAFVADCLETLEEIGMTGSASFIAAGGQEFILIPCLNTAPFWMDAAAEIIRSTMD